MDNLVVDALKWVALLLLSAVIDVPFFRVGSRLLGLRRYSFGATYLLALIVSGGVFIADLIVSPQLAAFPASVRMVASLMLSLVVSGWLIGYFMTTAERMSIGFAKGMQLALLVNLLFALAAMLLVAILARVLGSLDIPF